MFLKINRGDYENKNFTDITCFNNTYERVIFSRLSL